MTAKILAIAQQKGGAGKTTIAVQLAVSWAKKGFRVGMTSERKRKLKAP